MGPDGSNLDESLLVYHRYPFTLKYLNLSEQIQWWTPCLIKVFKICTKTVNQSNSIKNCKSHCVWIFSASPLPDCLSITSLADWSSENADTLSITNSSVISALWNLYCDFSFLHFFEYNPLSFSYYWLASAFNCKEEVCLVVLRKYISQHLKYYVIHALFSELMNCACYSCFTWCIICLVFVFAKW